MKFTIGDALSMRFAIKVLKAESMLKHMKTEAEALSSWCWCCKNKNKNKNWCLSNDFHAKALAEWQFCNLAIRDILKRILLGCLKKKKKARNIDRSLGGSVDCHSSLFIIFFV